VLSPHGWYVAGAPVDLRRGVDGLLSIVRQALGRDGFDGAAYVFRNRSGTRIKVVCCDAQGVWLCLRRLDEGRFVWPQAQAASWELSAQEFAWLCMGVDWRRLSRVRQARGL
jgi:transposase